ncbi:ash family protein [Pectobacterium aroidearum]|uniref:Ash family protein n=2 Tax=Pectobacteriaceae TaxID=1903410 RepID=A0ABR5ZEF3_9GAMM|nr:ash family protein [Pectobacterium aroidearum]MBA5228599.1 ash family protein [Pectobacterium aroidearum]MBA5232959.1 ash family protein [Pectobacterium aroidearum]MBA5738121.1 ash family protein [Pectobacterium aroidearum]
MYAITHPVNHGDSDKNCLLSPEYAGYSFRVAAKSATGICSPCLLSATPDAPCVFFCVVAFAHPFLTAPIRTESMVAQAGQLSGWPVSDSAGTANPVWATTIQEICSSGGSIFTYYRRLPLWLRSQPKLTPNLSFYFLPCVVLMFTLFRTVKPLLPRMNAAPAVCWRVTMCSLLLAVCRLRGRVMFDNTPLDLEEIIDQCRALAYALVELDQSQAKEVLTFVLSERLDCLHRTFHQPVAEGDHD